ncbi:MAG: uroporphyrinogen-III C-methyltransferase [Halobacteria archaeon]
MPDGKVYVVGGGPGDPELLTLKAASTLEDADTVLYDSLVGDGVLDYVADDAEQIYVGKKPGGERTTQHEINEMMVRRVRRGEDVVRLKGGDPCIFGRGGEELCYLARRDVEFELVPGVSSVQGAPTDALIPLTHRKHSSSFTVVTGHEDPSKPESALDWSALADNVSAGGTLVILMGVGKLGDNMSELIENGVTSDTPAALVEKATLDDAEMVAAELSEIEEAARKTGIEPPAVTVVGDVVDVARELEPDIWVSSGVEEEERDGVSGVPVDGVTGQFGDAASMESLSRITTTRQGD